jgi:hypothetical protein
MCTLVGNNCLASIKRALFGRLLHFSLCGQFGETETIIIFRSLKNLLLNLSIRSCILHFLYEWSVTIGRVSFPSYVAFVDYINLRL